VRARFLGLFLVVPVFLIGARGRLEAHPHIWVTMKEELLYAPDGSIASVRSAWTFDDMFSVFLTQGIQSKTRGSLTSEELAPLAKDQVTALKGYAYFTHIKVDGVPQKDLFADPVDYFLDYDPDQTVLTLHFTLPLKAPMAVRSMEFEIYDPEFVTYFNFAKSDTLRLVNASAQCAVSAGRPQQAGVALPEKNAMTSEANAGMGAAFARQMLVNCP
jgi:ABC-type uncharacterized transport system substrate-binding protein